MKVEDIFKKYGRKIEEQIDSENIEGVSRDYLKFKKEMIPSFSRYEKWAKSLGKAIKVKVSKKEETKIKKHLDTAHLDLNPSQVLGLALILSIIVLFGGLLFSMGIYFITDKIPFMFFFLTLLACLFLFYYLYYIPERLAKKWRLKASSQMVPAILYVVIYMKHTSNLEKAIEFASRNLSPPLALDFKKIFYDVEIGKFSNIKTSLENYLESWRDEAIEFIESFHLIESSLYEPSEARRVEILERALQVVLDGIYDKTLKFSREIRSPLTTLYMLGIVLPTLGLAMLPLASTLLQGLIKWYHVLIFFNVIIPFFVYYLANNIMLKRPVGYGETELLELNPLYPKYKSNKPYLTAALICVPLFLIGISPFFFYLANVDYSFAELGMGFLSGNLFDFKGSAGPYGLFALLLSLLIPFSIALFFAFSYNAKTKEIIKFREKTKKLEGEFTNSLFQLGNRLGDGTPAEIAFSKIAESSKGQITENFFRTVNLNLQQQGMSLENAIFHKKRGAIIYYPSSLIATSMRILIESVKKGLKIAARALMSISDYLKNIKKIEERLKDLLAEVVSDMKSNMTFLAPLLAGIVVGLGSMITTIINKLTELFVFTGETDIAGFGNIETFLDLFQIELMIPPYFLQVIIGIYVIEIIFILTSALVTVDAGQDRLKKMADTGKNLKYGILTYIAIAFIAIVVLSLLAGFAISGISP